MNYAGSSLRRAVDRIMDVNQFKEANELQIGDVTRIIYRSFGPRVTAVCAVLEALMPDQGTVDSAARWVVTSCPRMGGAS